MGIVGHTVPEFNGQVALGGEIQDVDVAQYRGHWLVLFFYPADFTFVCPTEILAFNDAYDQFKAVGAHLLGVSVDSVHSHLAWTRTPRSLAGIGPIRFPLMGDLGGHISKRFDVLHDDVALRGVFIIDPEGTVQASITNYLPVGRNIDEVYRTLRAAQHALASGEVCPANWQEGDEGMDATLEGVAKHIS